MTMEQLAVLLVLILPLAGAIAVAWLGPQSGPAIRNISVAVSVVTLVLSLYVAGAFLSLDRPATLAVRENASTFVPEFVPGSTADKPHQTTWNLFTVGAGHVQFFLGIDGLNLWLVVLTAVLMLPCVLVSFRQVHDRVNEFYAWLLALQTCMLGVFLSFDLFLFYVFFELSLVPLFFLIGIWGGAQRQYAARKFVIYTLTGSLLTMLGVILVVVACYDRASGTEKVITFSIPDLVARVQEQLHRAAGNAELTAYWNKVQFWVFLGLSAGFAIKVPLMPFHTWLPLAHTEAPTAGSVDLAGVLLKLGAYGFLRLCIPLCPDISLSLGQPLITAVAVLGIVYGALCAYAQDDVKKLIAYSSVSHLGLCMLGMFSLTMVGVQGSLFQMINHGLSTPALFLLIGMLYERYHTRKLSDYSGMASRMPLFAVLLVVASLSSVGLPGLNGFIGEFLCLGGILQYEEYNLHHMLLAVIGASGMILGAWYLFTMTRKLLFGPVKEPHHEGHAIEDLNSREWIALAPLMVLFVVLGVFPQVVLKSTEPDAQRVVALAERARTRARTRAMKAPNPVAPARAEADRRVP
jgi:NADH-quinone oxidoreductase subunit M